MKITVEVTKHSNRHLSLMRFLTGDNYQFSIEAENKALHLHSVMQAEGSDVSKGAAVGSEGAEEADMSGVELQPDEVCGCHYMTPVWAGSNQCMKCNKNRL